MFDAQLRATAILLATTLAGAGCGASESEPVELVNGYGKSDGAAVLVAWDPPFHQELTFYLECEGPEGCNMVADFWVADAAGELLDVELEVGVWRPDEWYRHFSERRQVRLWDLPQGLHTIGLRIADPTALPQDAPLQVGGSAVWFPARRVVGDSCDNPIRLELENGTVRWSGSNVGARHDFDCLPYICDSNAPDLVFAVDLPPQSLLYATYSGSTIPESVTMAVRSECAGRGRLTGGFPRQLTVAYSSEELRLPEGGTAYVWVTTDAAGSFELELSVEPDVEPEIEPD